MKDMDMNVLERIIDPFKCENSCPSVWSKTVGRVVESVHTLTIFWSIPWNICSPREILVWSHVAQHITLEIWDLFFWILGNKHCALKFWNKQRFGTCPKSFFGVKNVRHLTCGFKFSRFYIPESSLRGEYIEIGSQGEGCVQGLDPFKRFLLSSAVWGTT